ncbi:unnamed protein product, partial [Closterium sp. Yama58-4]
MWHAREIVWAVALVLLLVLVSTLALQQQQPSLLLTVLPAGILSSLGPIPHSPAAATDSPAAATDSPAAATDSPAAATDSDGRQKYNRHDSGKGFTGNGSAGEQGFELPNPPSRFNASAAWHQMQHHTAHSCWSQQERHLYHTANQSPPSAAFRDAVEEFEAMQRDCVGFQNLKSLQWVKDKATWNKTIPRYGRDRKQCRYISIRDINRGLGNRITSYIVSFVLGLLTHRAIIARPNAFLIRRFCNPFAHANATWTVRPKMHRLLWATVLRRPNVSMSALAKELSTQGNRVMDDMRRRVQEDGTVWLDMET